jgi:hypothetical protein
MMPIVGVGAVLDVGSVQKTMDDLEHHAPKHRILFEWLSREPAQSDERRLRMHDHA